MTGDNFKTYLPFLRPMRSFLVTCTFLLLIFGSYAADLASLEEKIADLQEDISTGSDDLRDDASQKIRALFIKVFSKEDAFDYPFDKFIAISTIKSPDNAFRLFNWVQPRVDGTFSYYAFILLPRKGEYVELIDNQELTLDLENKELTISNWYGALYYEIFPVQVKKESYYVLMGWDGNNSLSNKKVLDAIEIDKKGEITLGKSVFQTPDGMVRRRVFEYAKSAILNLRFMQSKDAIVFDRLEPEKSGLAGQYAFYLPSTAYNGYKLNKDGAWDLIEFIDMSRPKSEEKGAEFNFPGKVKFDRHRNNTNPIRQ